ncbi:MAG: GTPase HflX [Actinomycetota bacterium]|nr:GTPase HflX [Actinomycetota bacterium]MDI6822055.1 GTPase HflX [Actinomycetota bacterium]
MVDRRKERAILVAVKLSSLSPWDLEESLNELEQLVITAGGEVVVRVIQERETPHIRTFIGPGKAEEIRDLACKLEADLIVFDQDLTSSQQHNLEDIIKRKVIDRTALILDIFAQRAHSSEGKLQVELAQLVYLLPRIKGRGIELSRLGGGIGTRGPGETKLEVDRRRIRHRIQHLNKELKHLRQNRAMQRKKRKKASIFSTSIVGYTNAGKSTLLNTLTNAGVFVEDKLFATLDSTTRRLILPNNQLAVISDTVGFIKKLPHQLIAAFRSTLDEVREANLLVHIIDASHPQMEEQIKAVERVLEEIEAVEKPRINLFNKMDKLSQIDRERLKRRFPQGIFISALTGEGINKLLEEIEKRATEAVVRVRLHIPFSRGELIQKIYEQGNVISERHTSRGTSIIAELPQGSLREIKKLVEIG